MQNTERVRPIHAKRSLLIALTLAGMVLGCLNPSDLSEDQTKVEGDDRPLGQNTALSEKRLQPLVEEDIATRVIARPKDSEKLGNDGDAHDGGVLQVGFDRWFIPDPVIDSHDWYFSLDAELYSGLMRLADGPSALAEPDLASSYSVRDDGLVYEFTLRQDLRFSDGSPVTAADFKWSWQRALSLARNSTRIQSILGNIKGADAVMNGSSEDLLGVRVIDDRSLIVELDAPLTNFTALLADPVASVLKRTNVENWRVDWSSWFEEFTFGTDPYTFNELPVGTGPFKLEEFDFLADQMVFSRNEHYWDEPPRLDRIEFVPLSDTSGENVGSADNLTFTAQIDLAYDFGFSTSHEAEAQGADPGFQGQFKTYAIAPSVHFLAFNTAIEPYDDLLFRRALVAAADFDSFEEAYSGFDTDLTSGSVLPNALWPPGIPGYQVDATPFPYDIDSVIEELAITEQYSNGEKIKLRLVLKGVGLGSWFSALTSQWEELLSVEFGYDEVGTDTYKNWLQSGKLQMMHKVVTPRYADPHAIFGVFENLFGENAASPKSEKLQRMLSDAASESDEVTRLQKYREIERFVVTDALAIPLAWSSGETTVWMQPWVKGYNPPTYYGSRFKDVWIDASHPEYPK